MRTLHAIGSCVLVALAVDRGDGGDLLLVDDDAPPRGDGSTWETAYRFLQDALAHAARSGAPVREIRVAAGTYTPDRDESGNVTPGDRQATFVLLDGLTIAGGYAGLGAPDPDARDIDLYETILSGDLAGDDGACEPPGRDAPPQCFAENSYHVVTSRGADRTAELDGLTISGGNADGDSSRHRGGGLALTGSTATVIDCRLVGNWAGFGGGLSNWRGSPALTRCVISANGAISGGGIFHHHGSPDFFGCTIASNTASMGGGVHHRTGAASFVSCLVEGNTASGHSGGMYFSPSATPALTDCVLRGNAAGSRGGGISGPATLAGCLLERNTAYYAGALFHWWRRMELRDCTLRSNSALWRGGAVVGAGAEFEADGCLFEDNEVSGLYQGQGGAIVAGGRMALVSRCTFRRNAAVGREEASAGALFMDYAEWAHVSHCVFEGNVALAESPWGSAYGGGIIVAATRASIVDCTFTGNEARVLPPGRSPGSGEALGGGLVNWGYSPIQVANCTFAANQATGASLQEGGGIYNAWILRASGCVFHANAPDQIAGWPEPTIAYSCIEGGYEGPGNTDADPMLVSLPDPGEDGVFGTADDDYGDLRLTAGSPCIDAGINNAVGPDRADLDGDGDTGEFAPLDLDGLPRFVQDPRQDDVGCGFAPIVDMGAFEFRVGRSGLPTRGDIDGDSSVGTDDLALLLDAWGPAIACDPADLDDDGRVGIADLLVVLARWRNAP
jgi:hypothetical protein